jgi:hypothetical protein
MRSVSAELSRPMRSACRAAARRHAAGRQVAGSSPSPRRPATGDYENFLRRARAYSEAMNSSIGIAVSVS